MFIQKLWEENRELLMNEIAKIFSFSEYDEFEFNMKYVRHDMYKYSYYVVVQQDGQLHRQFILTAFDIDSKNQNALSLKPKWIDFLTRVFGEEYTKELEQNNIQTL